MPGWLDSLRTALDEGPDFFDALDRQLAPAFAARCGVGVDRFVFTPPFEPGPGSKGAPQFRMTADVDMHSVSGEIAAIDFAWPCEIAWRETQSGPVFEWRVLDAEGLRDYVAQSRAPFAAIAKAYPAEIGIPVWPHVTLDLDTGAEATPETLLQAIGLDPADPAPGGGHLHRIGAVHETAPGKFSLRIDFGSAGVEALSTMLDRIRARLGLRWVLIDTPRPGVGKQEAMP